MIVIGEKLNGSIPLVGKAIAARDEAFILALAKAQIAAQADYLDICASVSPEREDEALAWLIDLAQRAGDAPLCIDSSNPQSLLNQMERCSRPGMLNSVSLERGKLETVFPAVAGTSWRCVALLCSDKGIPDTVEGRMAAFDRIMEQADRYGVPHAHLFIDPLVRTLSTDESALSTFCACAREIRKRSRDVHIVSGLSNISFGLPARKLINHAFLVLALQAGMDAAIVDPCDRELTGLMHASEALLGRDEYCLDYIAAYRAGRFGNAASK